MISIERVIIQTVEDNDPDASWLQQKGWEERLAEYENSTFGFVGVRAVAEIKIQPDDSAYAYFQEITSPGLWGIESDSDRDYLEKSVGFEEMNTLRDILTELCVAESEIDRAFAEYTFTA